MEQTLIELERHLNLNVAEFFLSLIPQGSRKASAFIKHRLDGGHGVEHRMRNKLGGSSEASDGSRAFKPT